MFWRPVARVSYSNAGRRIAFRRSKRCTGHAITLLAIASMVGTTYGPSGLTVFEVDDQLLTAHTSCQRALRAFYPLLRGQKFHRCWRLERPYQKFAGTAVIYTQSECVNCGGERVDVRPEMPTRLSAAIEPALQYKI